jgi:hypothetical protein
MKTAEYVYRAANHSGAPFAETPTIAPKRSQVGEFCPIVR